MAPSSSSIPSLSPPLAPHSFTPIMECDREGKEDEEYLQDQTSSIKSTPSQQHVSMCNKDFETNYVHQPTPLHHKNVKTSRRRKSSSGSELASASVEDRGVSCNKCRPSNREKISVASLGSGGNNRRSFSSPNGILMSFFGTKKSPRILSDVSSTSEERWKIVATELSSKLVQATRKREEAVQEASKLKRSMAEIEKKINKLEMYCHTLKSGLDQCSSVSVSVMNKSVGLKHESVVIGDKDKVVENFLVSVSEARSTVRFLARSLTLQLRRVGNKVYDQILVLLRPYDIKVSLSRNPKELMTYIEALLNKCLFKDFESIGFDKSSANLILNPIDRCEANFASYDKLRSLEWDDVLNKGTKHFSEEFSKFCDRKMSEIVAMLGWNKAWPEPLLQAFFGASKAVWLVHLLANSVHPGLPIFRVDKEAKFDLIYMEDMVGDKGRRLVPASVRIMVVPGFYVYGNVVKCKVVCRYHNNMNGSDNVEEKGFSSIPSPK
ncbi:IRK-interacting protein-like [Apium graveolens]|uniref:IRK-interacting protein-like n=1 Tax=Apium graveolens TaxID=4045 RepID=UPI003D7AD495